MMKPEPATVHAAQDLKPQELFLINLSGLLHRGRACVFYDEDAVIGGGVIAKAGLNETLSG